jgi:Ferritin-like
MTKESPIVIKNREELILLLSEVSQFEHMLMCEYLFASFSLKRDTSEGVIVSQLQAIRRWERAISGVAVREMLQTLSRF